jgi:hypothetical protein
LFYHSKRRNRRVALHKVVKGALIYDKFNEIFNIKETKSMHVTYTVSENLKKIRHVGGSGVDRGDNMKIHSESVG